MKLTKEERETILGTSAADKHWEISTADPKHIRKFEKLGYELVRDDGCYRHYQVPLRAISFRNYTAQTN